jgi:hypothetical protein
MELPNLKNARSGKIFKLLNSQKSRAAYIKAKLSVLVPAQIRVLRLKSKTPAMPFQRDLARESETQQSRISMFETPGMANMTLETLSNVAAGLRCGVIVKFVPFSEMLRWENSFSPEHFDVIPRLQEDYSFMNPSTTNTEDSSLIKLAMRQDWDLEESPAKKEDAMMDDGIPQKQTAVAGA